MASPIGIAGLLGPKALGPDSSPEKIKGAAQQFESMLIEQMMKSARESGSGDWSGSAEDQTGSALGEMAEQQFAQLLAANGGMGLAKLVTLGLSKGSSRQEASVENSRIAARTGAPGVKAS